MGVVARALRQRILALAVAPALLLSGAAQALLRDACDTIASRGQCCCPHERSGTPPAKVKAAARQCCVVLDTPAPLPQGEVAAVTLHAAPVALAVPVPVAASPSRMQTAPAIARAAGPPGPSLVIAHRALLI
jgi:hypothetical protein